MQFCQQNPAIRKRFTIHGAVLEPRLSQAQTDVCVLQMWIPGMKNITEPAMSTSPLTPLLALYPSTHSLLPLWPVPGVFRLPPAAQACSSHTVLFRTCSQMASQLPF